MKIISVTSDRHNEGYLQLERSLKHFGYDYEHIQAPFQFGGQMQYVYEWCKANWGWFLYTDGWDTFALAKPDEIKIPHGCKLLISAEKNCYPHAEKASRYPDCETDWKYCNGGGFISECEYFVKIYEETHQPGQNDQDWLTECYLLNRPEIQLDTKCDVFQTIAFEGNGDFSRVLVDKSDGVWQDTLRVKNNKTGSMPVIFHGNAHTPMDKIYKLL